MKYTGYLMEANVKYTAYVMGTSESHLNEYTQMAVAALDGETASETITVPERSKSGRREIPVRLHEALNALGYTKPRGMEWKPMSDGTGFTAVVFKHEDMRLEECDCKPPKTWNKYSHHVGCNAFANIVPLIWGNPACARCGDETGKDENGYHCARCARSWNLAGDPSQAPDRKEMETTFETLYDSIAETLVTTEMPAEPETQTPTPE